MRSRTLRAQAHLDASDRTPPATRYASSGSIVASPGVRRASRQPPALPDRPRLPTPSPPPLPVEEVSSERLRRSRPGLRFGAIVVVIDDTLVIGRSRSADVLVDGDGVSRQHALLEMRGGELWIVDMASTNGLAVNGVRAVRARLRHGDVIRIDRHEIVVEW
jgi:hypothetical protein